MQAVLGLGLTVTLVGCDAAGLLDSLEVTADGPEILTEATDFNNAGRLDISPTTSVATTAALTPQFIGGSICDELQHYQRLTDRFGLLTSITTANVFCGTKTLDPIPPTELDGWNELTNVSMVVKLVNESEVTVTYGEAINVSDLENLDLSVNAVGLHLEAPQTDDYVGGVGTTSGVPLAYDRHDGEAGTVTYVVETNETSQVTPLIMYYTQDLLDSLQSGLSDVEAGGAISLGASDSAVQDALATATSVSFQLEADAPKFTGKRSN